MIGSRWKVLALAIGVAVGSSAMDVAMGQSTPSSPATDAAPVRKKPVRRKPAARATRVIPIETAPPSPPAPAPAAAQQKAADQRLLQQQQAQSDQAAQVTNAQVQRAQQQQEKVQGEVRVQDAPGPAQTGIAPSPAGSVAPASSDQRIQDAPGPAQTLPPVRSVDPSQLPAATKIQTSPASPPQ